MKGVGRGKLQQCRNMKHWTRAARVQHASFLGDRMTEKIDKDGLAITHSEENLHGGERPPHVQVRRNTKAQPKTRSALSCRRQARGTRMSPSRDSHGRMAVARDAQPGHEMRTRAWFV